MNLPKEVVSFAWLVQSKLCTWTMWPRNALFVSWHDSLTFFFPFTKSSWHGKGVPMLLTQQSRKASTRIWIAKCVSNWFKQFSRLAHFLQQSTVDVQVSFIFFTLHIILAYRTNPSSLQNTITLWWILRKSAIINQSSISPNPAILMNSPHCRLRREEKMDQTVSCIYQDFDCHQQF